MLPSYLLAVALAGHAEASGPSQSARFTLNGRFAPTDMLRGSGASSSNPWRVHGLDLTPLEIPQRIEFPQPYEIIDRISGIDRSIESYEEIITWLKENAPENTDQIKRFEKYRDEMKEMKEKSKDANRRRQD